MKLHILFFGTACALTGALVTHLAHVRSLPVCAAGRCQRVPGDMNGDEQLDIADAIHLLSYLFVPGSDPPADCPPCPPEIPSGSCALNETRSAGDFSLTLLWWRESLISVDGPYVGGEYYTFTAKPGRKFAIIAFRFRNEANGPRETPYLAGSVVTDKGHVFPCWSPPVGIHSDEYQPRPSTEDEVESLIGFSAGFVDLFPGEESPVGVLVFEVSDDDTPQTASLSEVDDPIVLTCP